MLHQTDEARQSVPVQGIQLSGMASMSISNIKTRWDTEGK